MEGISKLILRLLPEFFVIELQESIYKQLDLSFRFPSGIKIEVMSRAEWCIYNDIWVEGIYDAAILQARSIVAGTRVKILDLGANVGFFSLRCAHLLQADDYVVYAVEGSPRVFCALEQRMAVQPSSVASKLRLLHGLVGRKSGTDRMRVSHNIGMNSVSSLPHNGISQRETEPLAYLNLVEVMKGEDKIDLLKCDIEGSEREFIHNYGDLLARVKVAVFEFHHELCDVPALERRLGASGLRKETVLQDCGSTSVRLFRQEP
jgi:FkbM family methyltransferase